MPLKQCYLCGNIVPDATRDHVPPRSFFPPHTAGITLWACRVCNNGQSNSDELSRNIINLSRIGEINSHEYWASVRGIHQNQPLRNNLINSIAERFIQFDDVALLIRTFRIEADDFEKLVSFAKKITRGMYRYKYGEILNPNIPIQVYIQGNRPAHRFIRDIDDVVRLLPVLTHPIPSHLFRCYGGRVNEHPNASGWMFVFYDTFFISAFTDRTSIDQAIMG